MSTEPVEIINVNDFQMYGPAQQVHGISVIPFPDVSDVIPEQCDGECGTPDCEGMLDIETRRGMEAAVANLCSFLENAMEHHAGLDTSSAEAQEVRERIHSTLQRIHPAVIMGGLCTFADTTVRLTLELRKLQGEES